MKKKKDDDIQIRYAPGFIESMRDIPPEERDEIMEAIQDFVGGLEENPFLGTPLWGGPFRPLIIFWNWIKRTLWHYGLRW